MKKKNGKTFEVLLNATAIKDENGTIKATRSILRDISEIKKAQKEFEWEANINKVISAISQSFIQSMSIKNVSDIILTKLRELTKSKFGFVGYIDPDTGYLVCPTMTSDIWHICSVEEKSIVFKDFTGLWGWSLKNKKPLLTNDPKNDYRSSGTPDGHIPIDKFICAPCLIGEKIVGLIALANRSEDYTKKDLELIERFAIYYALIVERMLSEKKLYLTEFAINRANDAMFWIDKSAKFINVNETACKKLNYSKEELLKMSVANIDPNFPAEIWPQHWEELCEKGSQQFETTHKTKEGKTFPVEISQSYFIYEGIEYQISFARDITERKEAERALRESERKHKEAQKIAHLGHWELDLIKNKLTWSDEIFRIYGVEPHEFEANYEAFLNFVHPDDRETVNKSYTQSVKNKIPYDIVHRILLRNNTIRYVHEQCQTEYDEAGKAIRSLGTVQDITKQKEAEIELEKSKLEWKSAMDFFNDAIYLVGLDNKVKQVNQAFYEMTGLTPEETIGQNINKVIHPNGETIPCPVCKARDSRQDSLIVMEKDHPDNPISKPIEVMVKIIRDDDEKPLGVLMGIHDLTKQREVEDQLRLANNQLEDIVEERTKDLEQAYMEIQAANEELDATNEELFESNEELDRINRELEDALEKEKELAKLKDEFTSNVNHELKTPLTSILMTTQYLMKRIARLEREQINERLKRIDYSGKNLLHLVNEILDFARLEDNRLECFLEEISISKVFSEIQKSFQDIFENKGIDLIFEKPEPEIIIVHDFAHILKILNNLVSNAYKFTDKGYVKIKASITEDIVKISVVDTGQGIAKCNFNKIFERYQQLGNIENKAPGSGIGLHMVKKLTEKHGGHVLVESEIDRGSQFTIVLPKRSKWSN